MFTTFRFVVMLMATADNNIYKVLVEYIWSKIVSSAFSEKFSLYMVGTCIVGPVSVTIGTTFVSTSYFKYIYVLSKLSLVLPVNVDL